MVSVLAALDLGDRCSEKGAPMAVRSESEVLQAHNRFPSIAKSARGARAWSGQTLECWDYQGDIDDVVLVVSELVTNAVVHGVEPVELQLRSKDGGVQVRVTDCGVWRQPDQVVDLCERGRGLTIVKALSWAWGVEKLGRHGKTVWANVKR
jgi:anti-sigma regulatory factor (Ser/Thr protein kinase)